MKITFRTIRTHAFITAVCIWLLISCSGRAQDPGCLPSLRTDNVVFSGTVVDLLSCSLLSSKRVESSVRTRPEPRSIAIVEVDSVFVGNHRQLVFLLSEPTLFTDTRGITSIGASSHGHCLLPGDKIVCISRPSWAVADCATDSLTVDWLDALFYTLDSPAKANTRLFFGTMTMKSASWDSVNSDTALSYSQKIISIAQHDLTGSTMLMKDLMTAINSHNQER